MLNLWARFRVVHETDRLVLMVQCYHRGQEVQLITPEVGN